MTQQQLIITFLVLCIPALVIWTFWPTIRRKALPADPNETVVYLRTTGITPAKFMEARVYYDAWGTPHVWADAFRSDGVPNYLQPRGRTGSQWLQWKHKSGPDVVFPDSSLPDKGWFPPKS